MTDIDLSAIRARDAACAIEYAPDSASDRRALLKLVDEQVAMLDEWHAMNDGLHARIAEQDVEIERLQTVAQEQRHAADAYATECKELRDWQRRAVNISAPFAAWDLPHMASFEDDRPIFAIDGRTVTIGDVRRLRALIEEAAMSECNHRPAMRVWEAESASLT